MDAFTSAAPNVRKSWRSERATISEMSYGERYDLRSRRTWVSEQAAARSMKPLSGRHVVSSGSVRVEYLVHAAQRSLGITTLRRMAHGSRRTDSQAVIVEAVIGWLCSYEVECKARSLSATS